MVQGVGREARVSVVRVGSIAAGTDDERPVFVAPHNCRIESLAVVNAADLAAAATNFTTLSFQNKGSDGTGTDEVASFDNDSAGDNVSLSDFVEHDLGSLSNNDLSEDDVLSFKKADSGSGSAIDEMLVKVVWRPAAGLQAYKG